MTLARRRLPVLTAVMLLVIAVIGVLVAPAASAHAVLVGSSPADGSRLQVSPAAVRLSFDEQVQLVPGSALALSTTGQRVSVGDATVSGDGRTLLVALRPNLDAGVYTVTWRVVSADSHIVTGSIRFGVRHDALAAGTAAPTLSGLDLATSGLAWLLYCGLVLLVGAGFVVLALWPSLARGRRAWRLVGIGWWVVVVTTIGDLLLRGPRAAGSSWSGVLALTDLRLTLTSPAGLILAGRLAVLVAAGALGPRMRLGLMAGRRPVVLVLGLLGVGLLASVALLGHAAAGTDAWYLVPLMVVHLAAMSVWLGGLVVLALLLLPRMASSTAGRSGAVAGRVLRRWSRVAYCCLAAVVVSGEVQALATVSPVAALWNTRYGLLLVLKLALVVLAAVAAGGAHRLVFGRLGRTPRLSSLRRAVVAESVVLVTVLAVTSVLTLQPTARETYGPRVVTSAPLGTDQLQITVEQTRRGVTTIGLVARDVHGRVVDLQSVSGAMSTTGVAALDVSFRRTVTGGWVSTDAQAPLPGVWTLTLQVSVDQDTGYATSASWPVW